MTRHQVLELAERRSFPRVRIGALKVAGRREWIDLVRLQPARVVNQFLSRLQESEDIAPPAWPLTVPSTPRSTSSDVDRLRQLRLAQARGARDARPRQQGPTEAHWRAVREALEKFTGQGAWSYRGLRTLPAFSIEWDAPGMNPEAFGDTVFNRDGSIILRLRSTLSPERLHANVLHELQHIQDHVLVREGLAFGFMTVEILEARAQTVAEYLKRI